MNLQKLSSFHTPSSNTDNLLLIGEKESPVLHNFHHQFNYHKDPIEAITPAKVQLISVADGDPEWTRTDRGEMKIPEPTIFPMSKHTASTNDSLLPSTTSFCTSSLVLSNSISCSMMKIKQLASYAQGVPIMFSTYQRISSVTSYAVIPCLFALLSAIALSSFIISTNEPVISLNTLNIRT